jgi:hypothetical protein
MTDNPTFLGECICGRAQEYLGRRVEWRDPWEWRDEKTA